MKRAHKRLFVWPRLPLALSVFCLCGCGSVPANAPAIPLVQPSKAQLTLCASMSERIVACSARALSSSPNDGPRCGVMLANSTVDCREAFDNFAACTTGTSCARLAAGACRADYSATTAFCGGFLKPDAVRFIGIAFSKRR
jgi:hypothetical protein